MKQFLFCALACLQFLAGCTAPAGFAGTWQLQTYGNVNSPTAASGDARITFNEDGTISGNMGCNSFGGEYRIRGTQVDISGLMSTLMACVDDNVMRQESSVLAGLGDAGEFSLEGNRLVIYYDNKKQALTFQRAP